MTDPSSGSTGGTSSSRPSGLVRATADMLSATGEKIGTFLHQAKCSTTTPPPCAVFDLEETVQLPGGSIKVKTTASAPVDPEYPDHLVVGVHSRQDNLVEGTGVFAGRTGRARMSGWHGLGEFQAGYLTFNDFWLFELNLR
ncbi:MAG: hypothetical protein ACRDZ3_02575 [Acidimicrobiia bacterium]